ncbi:hypothetical protein BST81_08060 [Leptolyngbya sp. 'hensonii']|uniref:hypothetical protein n=1 Tax=Leptolyngbya sp. 'hensonii' TaxID=1922337 RepID=UPI0009500D2A|nr:hypothetical protein [Leptolyngbya sp. 'hensonii']OLP18862.1 hypothetical protein BST81_08060 [Leptolyngbya sp. 'hensonii']
MHPQIEAIFDEAESRYLKSEELDVLNQYVETLPIRLETYRRLRDEELAVMQQVADQLQAELPQEKIANLERSIKNALLMLRYCAMAMLLNDESVVHERLLSWLRQNVQTYSTQTIDVVLYRLLNQRLSQTLSLQQMNLFSPLLKLAQSELLNSSSAAI